MGQTFESIVGQENIVNQDIRIYHPAVYYTHKKDKKMRNLSKTPPAVKSAKFSSVQWKAEMVCMSTMINEVSYIT